MTLWTGNPDVVSITFNNPKSTCVWLRPQKRFSATNRRRTSNKEMRSFWYWWVDSDSQFHQFSGKELEFRPKRRMLILWFWFLNEGPVGLTENYSMHITSDSRIDLCSYSDQWCWDNNLFLHVTSCAATKKCNLFSHLCWTATLRSQSIFACSAGAEQSIYY